MNSFFRLFATNIPVFSGLKHRPIYCNVWFVSFYLAIILKMVLNSFRLFNFEMFKQDFMNITKKTISVDYAYGKMYIKPTIRERSMV